MLRKIVKIDDEKCNGCGACANACHEGAIAMVNGKAKLIRDDYCDGMGDCLPECPTGAISFEEREATAYNERAVAENKMHNFAFHSHGCPGSQVREMHNDNRNFPNTDTEDEVPSLGNWPVQIKLAPTKAAYYDGAQLLIAADCTAYAYATFHSEFVRGRVTLIGCPKLDGVDYSEKLAEIVGVNNIRDITLLRMEVPCCGGLEFAVKKALQISEKNIPLQVITISIDGNKLK